MAYAVRGDIENIFGKKNVAIWADADNTTNGSDITARINASLAYTEDYINSRLRRMRYIIPFDPVPVIIKDLCAQIAGCRLYEMPRGGADGDETLQPVVRIRKRAEATLDAIIAGRINLDAPQYKSAPDVIP